jgi:hypothetical protein
VAGEPVPDELVPAPGAIISSSAHQLQRLAFTHARYLRHTSGPLGRGRPQAQLLSNKTHYSPADPDARISVKPGKAQALNYLCSMAVDEGYGVISHVQAGCADQRDCTLLPSIVAPLRQRLAAHELLVQEVAANTNYSNGVNYALLEAQGITPWIPVFGRYKRYIESFGYDKEADCFACPAGKRLPFKRFDSDPDGRLSKRYSASTSDCRRCPRKSTCAPKSKCRRITRTAYDARYRRALARQQSWPGRHMHRLRQRTIEPVLRSLLQHYGLRRVNTRGGSSAHKTMLLTAIAFNLKKLLQHPPTKTRCLAIALPIPPLKGQFLRCWRGRYRHHNRLGNGKQE